MPECFFSCSINYSPCKAVLHTYNVCLLNPAAVCCVFYILKKVDNLIQELNIQQQQQPYQWCYKATQDHRTDTKERLLDSTQLMEISIRHTNGLPSVTIYISVNSICYYKFSRPILEIVRDYSLCFCFLHIRNILTIHHLNNPKTSKYGDGWWPSHGW